MGPSLGRTAGIVALAALALTLGGRYAWRRAALSPSSDLRAASGTAKTALRLPARVGAYTLRSLSPAPTDRGEHHALYLTREKSISLFLKPFRASSAPPEPHWRSIPLGSHRTGWLHSAPRGALALAWTWKGRQCIAVGRVPEAEMIAFARSFR